MAITIVTRAGKGAPLNAIEHDVNLTNLATAIEDTSSGHNHDGVNSKKLTASELPEQSGQSTFAGQTGRTVSIIPVVAATYHVDITPLAESGFIGEVWISTRTTNAFVVKNSGSDASSAFSWRISGATMA